VKLIHGVDVLSSQQSTRSRPQNEYWLPPTSHYSALEVGLSPCRWDTHGQSKLFCNSNLVETCIYLLSCDRRENIVHWLNTRPSLLVKPGNYHRTYVLTPSPSPLQDSARRNSRLASWEPTFSSWTVWYINRILAYVFGLCDDSLTLAIELLKWRSWWGCRKKCS
jgi:hypothetical protein